MSDGTLLVLQEGAEAHRLYLESSVLGRSQACDLAFDTAGVSRRHCEIVLRTDGVLLRDLGSSHGTYVNGDRIAGEAMLRRGDVVRLGDHGPRLRVLDARLAGVPLVDTDDDEPTRDVQAPAREQPRPRKQPPARDRAPAPGPTRRIPPTESVPPALPQGAGAGASPTHESAPAATSSTGSSATGSGGGLAKGLAIGLAIGVALGLGLLVVVGLDAWIAAARDALSIR